MSTPAPIAFEPPAKLAPNKRDTGSASDANSFADTMQAQRDADRSAATNAAPERNGSAQTHAQAQSDAKASAPAGDRPAAGGGRDAAAEAGKTGTTTGDKATASAHARGNAEQKAAQGAARTADQAAGKATEEAAKAAAAGSPPTSTKAAAGSAKWSSQASAQSSAHAAAQAASGAPTSAGGTGPDGPSGTAVLQNASSGQNRPVNAATAVAVHTASASGASSGKAGSHGKAGDATDTAASTTKAAAKDASQGDDPITKALKDAFAGPRKTGDGRRGEETGEPNAHRQEARPTGQRTAGPGMSPALRAAAEAVQQQLSGNGTTSNQGPGANKAGQTAPHTLRTDAAAPQPTGSGQTFDPVMQITGPQPGGAGQPGSLAAAGKAAPSAGTGTGNPAPTTPPAEQVAVQIQRAAAQGQSRVQIRLNPAELGRIDVKMEVGDDGHVRAVLAVDKPETLDLMQRDPRALERALQAAGLKTDQGSLNFSLRDDGTGQGQGQGHGREGPGAAPGHLAGQPGGDASIPAEALGANLAADGRVDIRV